MPMAVVYNDPQVHQFATKFHGITVFYLNSDEQPLATDLFDMLRARGDFHYLLL